MNTNDATISTEIGKYIVLITVNTSDTTPPTITGADAVVPYTYTQQTVTGKFDWFGVFKATSNTVTFSGIYHSTYYMEITT